MSYRSVSDQSDNHRWDRERYERVRAREEAGYRTRDHKFKVETKIITSPIIDERYDKHEDTMRAAREAGNIVAGKLHKTTDIAGNVVTEDTHIKVRPIRTTTIAERGPIPRIITQARRKTSLDTFDRPARPRYDQVEFDVERDLYVPQSAKTKYIEEDFVPRDAEIIRDRYRDYEVKQVYVLETDSELTGTTGSSGTLEAIPVRAQPPSPDRRSRSSHHSASSSSSSASAALSKRSVQSRKSAIVVQSPVELIIADESVVGSQKSGSSSGSSRSSGSRSSRSSATTVYSRRSGRDSDCSFDKLSYSMIGGKGFTRLPKKLVSSDVLQEMRLEYNEEDDHYRVERALRQPDINDIISRSEPKLISAKRVTKYRYPIYQKQEVVDESVYSEESRHSFEHRPDMTFHGGELIGVTRRQWINPTPSDRAALRPRRSSSPERHRPRMTSEPALKIVLDERRKPADDPSLHIVVKNGRAKVVNETAANDDNCSISPLSSISCATPRRAPRSRRGGQEEREEYTVAEEFQRKKTCSAPPNPNNYASYKPTVKKEYTYEEYDNIERYYPSTPPTGQGPPVKLIPTRKPEMVEYRPSDRGADKPDCTAAATGAGNKEYIPAPEDKGWSRRRNGWIRLDRDRKGNMMLVRSAN